MSNYRSGYLEQGAPLGSTRKDVLLSADNQIIDCDGVSAVYLQSDNTTATNRTFTLKSSDLFGQEVVLFFESGSSTTADLQSAGNAKLSEAWQPIQYDSLTLKWDGTYWIEVARGGSGGGLIPAGSIVNSDINASAAIAFSKLAALPSAQVLVGNGSNVATAVAVTGDVTISNAGVTAIGSGVVVNADISGSAAIDFSKLAALTSTNILVGSSGNVATSVAMSGDITIGNTGVTAIGAGKVLESMIGVTTGSGLFVKRYAKGIYNTAAGFGTGAHTLGATIPANSLVTGAWYFVQTTFTSSGDNATIALSVEGANDIFTATAISSGTTWDAVGAAIEGVPKIETTSSWILTTQARALTATVAVEAVTAGVMHVWVEYITLY